MKNLLTILLFLPLLSRAQVTSQELHVSEYVTPWIDSAGHARTLTSNPSLNANGGSGTPGLPALISTPGVTFVKCDNTLHGVVFLSSTGTVYVAGGNDQGQCGDGTRTDISTLKKLNVDSRGVALTNISIVQGSYCQITGGAQGLYFVKSGTSSDTVFYTGARIYGMGMTTGNDTVTAPTICWSLPAGKRIIQMAAGIVGAALLNDGTVWTWGANNIASFLGYAATGSQYATPHQVAVITDSVREIAGGAILGLIARTNKDSLYHWGPHGAYGGDPADNPHSTPTLIGSPVGRFILNGTTRRHYMALSANSVCFHALADDSTQWGWGDSYMGSIGNGVELDYANYSPNYYNGDPSQVLVQMIYTPVQVTAKHNFIKIFSGCLFGFTHFALDANGQIYGCGRNKGAVLGDGVVECAGANGDMAANYANAWDRPDMTPINPYALTANIPASCPRCKTNPGASFCSECTIPTTTPTAVIAGGNSISTTATSISPNGGSSTCTGGKLTYYLWKKLTGSGTIDVPAATQPNITGLSIGTSTFRLIVTDNGFNKDSTTLTVTASGIPPTVTPGGPYTITLPTSSQAISVTASGNGGATITGYAWTKTSGPGSTTILNNTTATATATGLQAGTYVFHCVVTDSNSSTTAVDVTVIVNPAPSNCNCVARPKRIVPK